MLVEANTMLLIIKNINGPFMKISISIKYTFVIMKSKMEYGSTYIYKIVSIRMRASQAHQQEISIWKIR